jgi:cellulose biosynthesis protein BcsQ
MRGSIFTFYSYKGGVGRSMALANIGIHFFKQGFTTLLIDWDLEAPGLERYFEQRYRLNLQDVNDRPGLCDMIKAYVQNISQPPPEDEDELPYPPISDYLYKLDAQGEASLLLMHAGRRVEGKPWQDYASFVQNFDWADFYKECEGGLFFEWFRTQLEEMADVILIDSRTGVTEMGGVAAQHMSDVVVLICGSNRQNIENTARMGLNFISEGVRKVRGGRPLDIIVAPARIDDADSEGFGAFHKRLKDDFSNVPMRVLDDGFSMEDMLIPYMARFSYQESLVIGDSEFETVASRLVKAYHCIASNMKLLSHEQSALKTGPVSSRDSTQPSVFVAYAREDEPAAQKIIEYLKHHEINVNSGNQRKIKSSADFPSEIAACNFILILVSSRISRSVTLRNLISQAEEVSKTIIPVRIDDTDLPYWLYHLHFVDIVLDFKQGMEKLVDALHQPKAVTGAIEDFRLSESMIYISHSFHDREIAHRIASGLRKRGFVTWIAEENIRPGSDWQHTIEKALDMASALVALISSASNQSKNVAQEWAFMQGRGKAVLPLLLEREIHLPLGLATYQGLLLDEDFDHSMDELSKALQAALSRKNDARMIDSFPMA